MNGVIDWLFGRHTLRHPSHARVEERIRFVQDAGGRLEPLGREIASGGEGSVHALANRPDKLVKLYHPQVLAQRGSELEAKIREMAAQRSRFESHPLAWPALPVYDGNGRWLGYAMRRVNGKTLSRLAHPLLQRRHFSDIDRAGIARMLETLIRTIGALHANEVCIGDFNLNNFLFDPASGPQLIDCDSYQTKREGRLHRCHVITADMMPPEHQGKNLSRIERTPQSDMFSFSILVFRCFMLGRHPYDFIGGGSLLENLQRGHFPYGLGGAAPGTRGAIPPGPWYLMWSHLSFQMKTLLVRSFSEGALDPSARPTISEWRIALAKYAEEIDRGYHDRRLKPPHAKSNEDRRQSAQDSA